MPAKAGSSALAWQTALDAGGSRGKALAWKGMRLLQSTGPRPPGSCILSLPRSFSTWLLLPHLPSGTTPTSPGFRTAPGMTPSCLLGADGPLRAQRTTSKHKIGALVRVSAKQLKRNHPGRSSTGAEVHRSHGLCLFFQGDRDGAFRSGSVLA